MTVGYAVFVFLFVAALSTRSGYERLKDAGRINPESKPIFILIFTVMCILWACWFSLCPLDPIHIPLPEYARWGGYALVVAGLVLAVGALMQLKGLENIDRLVTSGLFARIRHPMYAGFVLWILGWSLYHQAALSLVVGLLGIGHIVYWGRLEERRLLARYGQRYREYQSATWL
jgi:protein-S-isoprenylcysteine O-methyltransferase Ste14